MMDRSARHGQRRRHLVYIVIDASASMRTVEVNGRYEIRNGEDLHDTPLGVFYGSVQAMLRELSLSSPVRDKAWVSVVGFSNRAELLRPMTAIDVPWGTAEPTFGDETDFEAVFDFLAHQFRKDSDRARQSENQQPIQVARPWVFFITDGAPYRDGDWQPPSVWVPRHRAFTGAGIGARIIAIGLPGANELALWYVATGNAPGPDDQRNAFIAVTSSDAAGLVTGVVNAIKNSISQSVQKGTLVINAPRGMRRIAGPRHD